MASAFVKSQRLQQLPPYLFAEIDRKKKAAIAAGRDVINLGVGDPDTPTPEPIIRSLQSSVENPAYHQYALDQGAPELRQSIAAFCHRRYGLTTPPATFYVWIPCPAGISSMDLCARLLEEVNVVTTPGVGFGASGEGYIRATLTVPEPRLKEAVERIATLKLQ